MLRSGNLASAGGPSQPAETGFARAETLGPDGGQRTWKPGPDAAVGPTGAQESAPSLFPYEDPRLLVRVAPPANSLGAAPGGGGRLRGRWSFHRLDLGARGRAGVARRRALPEDVHTSRRGDGTSDSKTQPAYSLDPHAMERDAHTACCVLV